MKEINTYLFFDGNCREAMSFYHKCLGGSLEMMPFTDMPGGNFPPEAKNRIMHATLRQGDAVLMASDTMPGMPHTPGNNYSVSIDCESQAETENFFNALEQG